MKYTSLPKGEGEMKRLLGMALIMLMAMACNNTQLTKQTATDNTFQIKMPRPVYLVERVAIEETEVDEDERIKAMIADAIAEEKQKAEDSLKIYQQYLTDIEAFGHKPTSRTHIPIGSISGVPEWARFPERILTVYKIDKQEISEWEKDSEKDVLAISEVAEVSISKAKGILSKLRSEGYSVSKDVESVDDEIELLYFQNG